MYVFSTPPVKGGNGIKILEKDDKVVLFPAHRMERQLSTADYEIRSESPSDLEVRLCRCSSRCFDI